MGKSTISMAIFNCYVSSPEGNYINHCEARTQARKNDPQPIVRDPAAVDSNQLLPWADFLLRQVNLVGVFIHLEKYQSMGRIIPYMMENKQMFQTTNQQWKLPSTPPYQASNSPMWYSSGSFFIVSKTHALPKSSRHMFSMWTQGQKTGYFLEWIITTPI